jgi:wobble nucleotide-excising tRNase
MYGLNRYICDVLEEMRTSVKTLNFAMIPSLIEEVQTMANRMEMALSDMKDLKGLKEEIVDKKEEYETLKDKIRKIEKTLAKKKKKK